jgi:hypothetical protein
MMVTNSPFLLLFRVVKIIHEVARRKHEVKALKTSKTILPSCKLREPSWIKFLWIFTNLQPNS